MLVFKISYDLPEDTALLMTLFFTLSLCLTAYFCYELVSYFRKIGPDVSVSLVGVASEWSKQSLLNKLLTISALISVPSSLAYFATLLASTSEFIRRFIENLP